MRVQRKKLITAVQWSENSTLKTEVLGLRTPDSSIEYNQDKQKTTDVLGITHADIEKTEPTQTFDPHYLSDDSDFDKYLMKAAMENDIDAYNGVFDILIIDATQDSGTSPAHAYYTVKHKNCTVAPTSLGGESYVGMPIELDFSNDIVIGTVDKLGNDLTFTANP